MDDNNDGHDFGIMVKVLKLNYQKNCFKLL